MKKPHIFKPGMRASFGGMKGTCHKNEGAFRLECPIEWQADNHPGHEIFTEDGRFWIDHTKPLLKPLRKKKKKRGVRVTKKDVRRAWTLAFGLRDDGEDWNAREFDQFCKGLGL